MHCCYLAKATQKQLQAELLAVGDPGYPFGDSGDVRQISRVCQQCQSQNIMYCSEGEEKAKVGSRHEAAAEMAEMAENGEDGEYARKANKAEFSLKSQSEIPMLLLLQSVPFQGWRPDHCLRSEGQTTKKSG